MVEPTAPASSSSPESEPGDAPEVTRELPAAVPVDAAPAAPAAAVAPTPAAPVQTLGILSLILGIVGLLASAAAFGLVFGIAAVVLGHQSLRREPTARGMALGGLATGYASIAISVVVGIVLLASLLIPLFAIGLFAGLGAFGG